MASRNRHDEYVVRVEWPNGTPTLYGVSSPSLDALIEHLPVLIAPRDVSARVVVFAASDPLWVGSLHLTMREADRGV